jgi:hypothetical protein
MTMRRRRLFLFLFDAGIRHRKVCVARDKSLKINGLVKPSPLLWRKFRQRKYTPPMMVHPRGSGETTGEERHGRVRTPEEDVHIGHGR